MSRRTAEVAELERQLADIGRALASLNRGPPAPPSGQPYYYRSFSPGDDEDMEALKREIARLKADLRREPTSRSTYLSDENDGDLAKQVEDLQRDLDRLRDDAFGTKKSTKSTKSPRRRGDDSRGDGTGRIPLKRPSSRKDYVADDLQDSFRDAQIYRSVHDPDRLFVKRHKRTRVAKVDSDRSRPDSDTSRAPPSRSKKSKKASAKDEDTSDTIEASDISPLPETTRDTSRERSRERSRDKPRDRSRGKSRERTSRSEHRGATEILQDYVPPPTAVLIERHTRRKKKASSPMTMVALERRVRRKQSSSRPRSRSRSSTTLSASPERVRSPPPRLSRKRERTPPPRLSRKADRSPPRASRKRDRTPPRASRKRDRTPPRSSKKTPSKKSKKPTNKKPTNKQGSPRQARKPSKKGAASPAMAAPRDSPRRRDSPSKTTTLVSKNIRLTLGVELPSGTAESNERSKLSRSDRDALRDLYGFSTDQIERASA